MNRKTNIPASEKEGLRWKTEIERAEEKRKRNHQLWKENTAAMAGRATGLPEDKDFVVVNKDYPRVKQKISQICFDIPEVTLKPRQEAYRGAVYQFQAVLNYLATSEDRMNAQPVIDEVLTDVLCAAGIGAAKVGYENTTVNVDMPMDPAEVPPELQPAMLATGQVPSIPTPKPIYENYYLERISPAKLLIPEDFTGSDFDKAPWLGFEFRLTLDEVKRKYKVPADFNGGSTDDNRIAAEPAFTASNSARGSSVKCYEIWYWASRRDKDALHPKHMRRCVYIEGIEKAVLVEDSPFQNVIYQGGKSVGVSGVTRFPIRVLTLTYISDQAIPPSDCTISRPQVKELWKSRTQMMLQRERGFSIRTVDQSRVDEDVLAKIESGDIGDILPVDGPGDEIFHQIAPASYPRENFQFDNIISDDLDEMWSMGGPALGGETRSETTKYEVRAMQGGMAVRLNYERGKFQRWWTGVMRCVGDMVQMFADDEDYIEVVGPDGTRELQAWDKTTVAGDFVYSIKPDSGVYLDAAQERQDAVRLYQMMANEPHINRVKLVESVISKHHIDPTHVVIPDLPPKPAPEPNLSFRFAGEDINPSNPNFPIVMTILQQGGIPIPPEIIAAAQQKAEQMNLATALVGAAGAESQGAPPQTQHGGAAQQQAPLSKHAADGKTT
jgi:hypothetical protein